MTLSAAKKKAPYSLPSVSHDLAILGRIGDLEGTRQWNEDIVQIGHLALNFIIITELKKSVDVVTDNMMQF